MVSLAQGRLAAEQLASALLGFSVRKALDPLSPEGFLLIGQTVAEKLRGVVKGGEAKVVADVIHKLGFDWKELSPDAAAAAMNAVNKAINDSYATHVLPKIADTFEVEGPKVMGGTKASLKARQKVDISIDLSRRDLQAEKAIRKSQVNFIRDSTGDRAVAMSKKARSIVAKGLADGLGSEQISKDLKEHYTKSIPRPESYWRTVADSFVGRARTTSQVYSYEEASIETVEVVAVIDEVTTDQCRFMDGKVFTVSSIREVLDTLSELENPEDVRFANPWIRKGRDADGQMRLFVPHADGGTTTIAKIDRSGVGRADDRGRFSSAKDEGELSKLGVPCPPYHGRCRTTLVASAETSSARAPVMVPGADLEPTATAEAQPAAAASDELFVPDWMSEEKLDVTSFTRAGDGVNGARMLTVRDGDTSQRGIWKPISGEYNFENEEGRALRPGVKPGTYHQREAAAYEVDQLIGGESVVPPTIVREHGGEVGSMQAFAPGAKPTSDVDWKSDAGGTIGWKPDEKLSSELAADPAVKKQFLLDLIGANDDRHSENTLWRKVGDKLKPVAIDNGLAFPTKPTRFLFAIDSKEFQVAMLKVDPEMLANVELPKLAAILKKYDGITEKQIANALARVRSLQNAPEQLASLHADNPAQTPNFLVYQWLTLSTKKRPHLTSADIDYIEQLAKR